MFLVSSISFLLTVFRIDISILACLVNGVCPFIIFIATSVSFFRSNAHTTIPNEPYLEWIK